MVAVRNIQGWPEERHRLEQVVGKFGVFAHDNPILLGELVRLAQDFIRHAHFANIVQQRPAPDVYQLSLADSQGLRQGYGHLGHAPGMTFGFAVA